MTEQRIIYGGWIIYYDPPPIPVRSCDWHFYHADLYDCDCDQDGFFGNDYAGSAASVEACKAEIADIEEDRDMPSTAQAQVRQMLQASAISS